MKNYLKLVNFEFNRVAKLFAVLLGITFAAQLAGVMIQARRYLNNAHEMIYIQMMPEAEFLETWGRMSFLEIVRSEWFLGPIALCIAAVGIYIFFIWYRDWLGKNTFIYRLLMLPTTRLNLFYAKMTTILLITLGLAGFQLIIFPVEIGVFNMMIPEEFRRDLGMLEIIQNVPELYMIMPASFIQLVLYYGLGTLCVAIIFTGILLERSFKWKGIIAAILYGAAAAIVLISPLLLQDFVLDGFFYPGELLTLVIVMGLIVFAACILMSRFLLKKKINV